MTTTFNLVDSTNLQSSVAQAYVAGWINGSSSSFQVLQSDGTFGGSGPTSVPFYLVSLMPSVTLDVATNGNDQLLFVVSPTQPTALTVLNSAPQKYTQYPYPVTPGIAAPGPFDIFEFGLNAQDDVSAVSGFGLNLSFAVSGDSSQQFGVASTVTRQEIGAAFTAFIANEAAIQPAAKAFAELLYDGPINVANAPAPPSIDGQFFAISDPNDMLNALTNNYTTATDDPLATFWDSTLNSFFAAGNYLSINLSGDAVPNVYSGQCTSTATGTAYTLTNGTNTYTFPNPLNSDTNPLGFAGAQYVFQQAFGPYTPSGAGGDAGLLQDSIWQALCRGVAMAGVFTSPVTGGASTFPWNDWTTWYTFIGAYHVYAKFLHYSDANGNDSRTSGQPPIFIANAAYGFSEDENPDGPYSGPNVPSKSADVPDGSTVTITVGPWDSTGG
ncbi:hypothetical protein [Reyranella sp.]|uniref:hypothetical protein n=1 Tax=Reyranella sp. TaxID=1929291 RepID=UPI00272FEF57|nr:hypothetical protein [Reyranella sp.]MDP2372448.1 hypothetical protein [Reyranella sp.]